MNTEPLFHEEQRFRQKWLWGLMGAIIITQVAVMLVILVQIWVFGETVDGNDSSDFGLLLVFVLEAVILGSLVWLIWNVRLITEVHPDGVHVRFVPLHRKFQIYHPAEIANFEARIYRPIMEYGGWGIRYGTKGKAFNVSGNQGVQFEFADGKRLLIGTQQPEAFVAALNQIK